MVQWQIQPNNTNQIKKTMEKFQQDDDGTVAKNSKTTQTKYLGEVE